jgi:two-component system, OmpR family, phosphate regulon sensor histidine kinase PhoR
LRFLDFLAGFALGLICLAGWQQFWQQRLKRLLRLFRQAQPIQVPPPNPQEISPTQNNFQRLATTIESQQRLLTALEQHMALLQQILELAPLAYLQVDWQNQLVWMNPQATKLLGIEGWQGGFDPQLNELGQRRFLLQIIRSYELDQLVAKTQQDQISYQADWVYHPPMLPQRSHPQQLPLRGYSFPLKNGDIVLFLEDRREAVSLKEARDRWISDVAHELKTPLTSMRLVAETLQGRVEPNLQLWVIRFLHETTRLGNLVQDLLELGRLTLNPGAELRFTTVDLPALVRQAWGNLEPLAQQKQLQFDYRGPKHLPVKLDQPHFFRAILNLVDNAIRYSPNGGKVQVRLEKLPAESSATGQSHTLCLEVIDAGSGFSPTDLPHVFERFYRAEASRNRDADQMTHKGGSGLGLAIVQQIITAHQGVITAQNHPETGGAWMRIILPSQDPEE